MSSLILKLESAYLGLYNIHRPFVCILGLTSVRAEGVGAVYEMVQVLCHGDHALVQDCYTAAAVTVEVGHPGYNLKA